MYTSVPAFWKVPLQTGTGCVNEQGQPQDCWQVLIDSLNSKFPGAGKANLVVVGDDTWPNDPNNPGQPIPGTVQAVNNLVQHAACTVFGYVTIRESVAPYNLRPPADVATETAAWLNQYNLDGIYFDMAVLPGYDITQVKPYAYRSRKS